MQASSGETERAGSTSLWSNRDFRFVLAGQAISALGDAISITAMPLLVLLLTGSGGLMGAVAALQVVPDLVLGLPAGAIADRTDRRRLMLWSDLGRAVLTALIPMSHWLGFATMPVVLAVALPANVLRVLSDAAYTSAIPKLVGRDHLARANGYIEATLSVPFIVGPALAGVLVATIGAAPTIAIDATSFAVSAGSLVFVRRSLAADRGSGMPRFVEDIKEGVAFVWRSTALRSLIGYSSAITVATAGLLPALAYYLTVDRDHGPDLFGVLGSVWSIGYLGGSLFAGRLSERKVGVRLIACGLVIGVAIALIAQSSVTVIYLFGALLIGGALAVQVVSYMTLRASITPDALLGRVGSSSRVLSLGLRPVGLVAVGVVIEATGGRMALLLVAVLTVASSLAFVAARSLREAGTDITS